MRHIAGGRREAPIRVLVADDEPLFRRGVGLMLGIDGRIEVVAEAEDGEEAISWAVELAPDVVLMDAQIPKVNGTEATRIINERVPTTRIIILTVSDEEADLYETIRAGAIGYLLKEISVEQIADAVKSVYEGHSLLTPSMASRLLTGFQQQWRRTEEADPSSSSTLHELDILKLVAKGMTNHEIGEALTMSENTVKNHIRNILERLHRGSHGQDGDDSGDREPRRPLPAPGSGSEALELTDSN